MLPIAQTISNPRDKSIVLSTIVSYLLTNPENFSQAIEISQTIPNQQKRYYTLMEIGNKLAEAEQFKPATDIFLEARKLIPNLTTQQSQSQAFVDIASGLVEVGESVRAESILDQALVVMQ